MPSTVVQAEERTAAANGDDRAGKYLVFQLGREEFGIRVLKAREIMGVQDITAVPQQPGHVKGVINLRGKVIPVVDLRLKFGLPPVEYTQRTCIIVVQLRRGLNSVLTGIVVDSVADVLNLAAADIEDTPDWLRFGHAVPAGNGQSQRQGQDPAGYRRSDALTGTTRAGSPGSVGYCYEQATRRNRLNEIDDNWEETAHELWGCTGVNAGGRPRSVRESWQPRRQPE